MPTKREETEDHSPHSSPESACSPSGNANPTPTGASRRQSLDIFSLCSSGSPAASAIRARDECVEDTAVHALLSLNSPNKAAELSSKGMDMPAQSSIVKAVMGCPAKEEAS